MSDVTVSIAIIDANEHGCVYIGSPEGEGVYLEPEAAAHIAGMMFRCAVGAGVLPGQGRNAVGTVALLRKYLDGLSAGRRSPLRRDEGLSDRIRSAKEG